MTFGSDQNFGMPGTGPTGDDLTRQITERLHASELRSAQAFSQTPNTSSAQNSALAETLSSIVSHIETSDQRTAQAFQGLQQQMALMGQNVQDVGNSSAIKDLENRLNNVVRRLEANMTQNAQANGQLETHVSRLANQMAAGAQNFDQESAELKALDHQLQSLGQQQGQMSAQMDDLAQRVHQNVAGANDPHISALQNQVQELQSYIDTAQPGAAQQPGMDHHISEISNRLAETENRLNAISSLEANIQELSQRVSNSPDPAAAGQDSPAFKALNQALGALRMQAKTSEDKTNETLEAVHDTLEKVITRIAQLEQSPPEVIYRGEAQSAAPVMSAPVPPQIPEEFQQPNMAPPPTHSPMEMTASMSPPPSTPYMGVAADMPASPQPERPGAASQSFIQAARKAAQANITGKSQKEESAPKPTKAEGKEGPSKSRRKPLLIAAAAVLLVIGGLHGYKLAKSGKINVPVIGKYIGGDAKVNAQAPAHIGSENKPTSPENTAPAGLAPSGIDAAPDKPLPATPQSDSAQNQSTFSPQKSTQGETPTPVANITAPQQGSPFIEQAQAKPIPAQAEPKKSNTATTSSLTKQKPASKPSSELTKTAAVKTTAPQKIAPLPPVGSGYKELPVSIGSESLRRAAASGNRDAQFVVATKYLNGQGVKKDISKAIIWYQRAAAKGLAPAQYRLGTFYEKGRGVKKDKLTARIWYERAAEQGNRKSMHNLAVIYADANNGKPDFTKAALWFRKASERDLTDSQFNMAILSERGLGVPKDPVEAYKWFAIAGAKGDKDSESRKNALAQKMDPRSLVLAKLAVDNWSPRPVKKSANYVDLNKTDWQFSSTQQNARYVQRQMISEAQSRLNKLGYKAGPPDGIMGKRTRDAIKTYQKKMGLKVTGSASAELIRHLRTKTS